MKIAIFGGTGRTGKHLINQALADGYDANVLARTPAKLEIQYVALTVIEGDAKEFSAVEKTIQGTGAVLSVLGPSNNEPAFEVSKGMTNILAAMQKQAVNRLIISAGAGVGDPNDAPKLFNHFMNFLLKLMAKNVQADMLNVVEMIRSSDVEWTIVRVPMLTNDPQSGELKVGYVGKGMGSRISRADLADFMLKQINDRSYIRQAPAISN